MYTPLPIDKVSGPSSVSTGHLPPLERVTELVDDAYALYRPDDEGKVADYIPALAKVPRNLLGICVVGVNSTGLPFNSVMAVELNQCRTMNPMVNVGAIAAASLVPGATADEKWRFIQDGVSRFASRKLELNTEVCESEAATNLRNRGIAKLREGYGRIYFDALLATDVYTKQCSPKVNAQDLAVMGATLAGAEATR